MCAGGTASGASLVSPKPSKTSSSDGVDPFRSKSPMEGDKKPVTVDNFSKIKVIGKGDIGKVYLVEEKVW